MNVDFRIASPEDHAPLLALEDLIAQGETFSIAQVKQVYDPKGQFLDDRRTVMAVDGRAPSAIVGAISGGTRRLWFEGSELRCAYAYNLKVHPARRRQGIGLALIREVEASLRPRSEAIYRVVDGENRAMRRILCGKSGCTVIGSFGCAMLAAGHRGQRREDVELLPAPLATGRGERLSLQPDMEDLCKGPAFRGQFRRPAGTPAACSGTPVAPGAEASCCCWDDSVLAKTVFRRVPLRFRLLRPLSRLLAPFGLLPRIPRQNAELTSWTLFAVDCSPPAALAPLLQHLLWVAGGHKLDGLSLVLDLRDPAAAVVARLATARVIHDVYFKYWDGRPVPPPARLLFADPRN